MYLGILVYIAVCIAPMYNMYTFVNGSVFKISLVVFDSIR